MTIQELMESAQLDAMGLLDEREREEFDRAFRAAPAALQSQLRREQERLCRADHLLPEGEPPAGLFDRILASIRAARREPTPVEHDGAARVLPMTRADRVHRFWRAAAIGFATASVVLGGVFVYIQRTTDSVEQETARLERARQLIAALDRQFYSDQLFAKDTGRFVFVATAAGFPGKCSVWTNSQWDGNARLYCQSVATPPDRSLRLVVLDAAGKVESQLAEFTSKGDLETITFKLGDSRPSRLALVSAPIGRSASDGEVLMRVA